MVNMMVLGLDSSTDNYCHEMLDSIISCKELQGEVNSSLQRNHLLIYGKGSVLCRA